MADSPPTLAGLVTRDAVEAQFGEEFDEPELTQVEVFIDRARDEILDRAPLIDTHLAAGTVKPVRVRGVGVDVVIRAIENTRIGHRVTSTEFPEIKTQYSADAEELIYLTASELAKLQPSGTASTLVEGGPYVVSLSG